jgi:hypothetical protein
MIVVTLSSSTIPTVPLLANNFDAAEASNLVSERIRHLQ